MINNTTVGQKGPAQMLKCFWLPWFKFGQIFYQWTHRKVVGLNLFIWAEANNKIKTNHMKGAAVAVVQTLTVGNN